MEWQIKENADYAAYFNQFKTIWETSKQLEQKSSIDENAAWQRFKNRTIYREQNDEPVIKKSFSWMRVAASVAGLIGIALVVFLMINKQEQPKEIAFQSLQQVLKDTLPDASVVTLNKNSTITYPEKFEGDTRPVALKGEAFFNVTPDKEKPFIISVNDVQVKVVGTSFNIKETKGTTEVVVETGVVQVTQHGKTVELRAGEKINLSPENTTMTKEEVKDKLYNYYRTKEFVCEETPLWKLVEILNQAYNANIIIENKAIRTLPITTTFYNESLDQVLLIIGETFNISVTKKENSIVLQ